MTRLQDKGDTMALMGRAVSMAITLIKITCRASGTSNCFITFITTHRQPAAWRVYHQFMLIHRLCITDVLS